MCWGHFHPFGFIFLFIIAGLIITHFVRLRRGRGMYYRDPYDAINVLENRLAKGEITSEEYKEIRETLNR